jgi:BirA family transcriptional regulator, biotin operon repressor / biotin---[acetyl-CoA-carboxylase] ligase
MNRLRPRLPPSFRLFLYDSIGSTNDEAKRLARDGAPAGTLVWALEQTNGRGRRGRAWASPRGNLYASLIWRPDCPASRAAQLGFVAALAVGRALGTIVPGVGLIACKWPNDVLVNGRKVAGILLETELDATGMPRFLVVGVGVNLASSPRNTEFPATSVVDEGLGAIPPEVMLEQFVQHFQSWELRWHTEGFAPVRAAWLAASAISPGEPVRARLDTAILQGRFLDIDEDGGLLLELAGERRSISAGDVFPVSH